MLLALPVCGLSLVLKRGVAAVLPGVAMPEGVVPGTVALGMNCTFTPFVTPGAGVTEVGVVGEALVLPLAAPRC